MCAEGTPVLALDLALRWRDLGHEVHIATLFAHPSDMLDEYRQAGFAVRCLGIRTSGYYKFWQLVHDTYCACVEVRPSVVVCFPFGWHCFVAIGARAAGVRRVVSHAGNHPTVSHRSQRAKMALFAHLGALLGARIICCSEYVKSGVRHYLHLGSKSLYAIPNGIDTAKFSTNWDPSVAAPYHDTQPVLCGMVARFEVHKDHPTLLRAIKLLKDGSLNVQLELVGDGTRSEEYHRLRHDLNLEDSVTFLGVRRDVVQVLKRWDLFIFATTDDEGLGIALVEAVAAGIPVIASDVGACREALSENGSGLLGQLVAKGCPAAIAEAVRSYAENRGPWLERAKRAHYTVCARFDIRQMADEYLKVMA